MENKSENKFEVIASHFHDEDHGNAVKNLRDDADLKAVGKIYSLREKVNQLAYLGRVEDAQVKVDRRISGRSKSVMSRNFKVFRYAAVIFILVALTGVLGIMTYRSLLSEKKEIITKIVSSTGEMKEMVLPDGTKVWLGANSIMKYDEQFGEKNREVMFNGEAMFDVVKNEKLSFLVKLENAFIQVHGTKFLVTSYSERNKNEVILFEGKVKYQQKDQAIFISPGERLTDNQLTGEIVRDQVDLKHYNDWINGKVYLDNKELGDLAFLLEQWYGVKFVFSNDNLTAYKFTGIINKEKPLDYVLKIITLTNKVKFKKEGEKIMITN
jgi:ferric-dicitrate binding protein FerR (iron transport regulator)